MRIRRCWSLGCWNMQLDRVQGTRDSLCGPQVPLQGSRGSHHPPGLQEMLLSLASVTMQFALFMSCSSIAGPLCEIRISA